MAETTTDVTLGFVSSMSASDALTDSQTHQGQIYFPTDDTCIIKNNKQYGMTAAEKAKIVSAVNFILTSIYNEGNISQADYNTYFIPTADIQEGDQ